MAAGRVKHGKGSHSREVPRITELPVLLPCPLPGDLSNHFLTSNNLTLQVRRASERFCFLSRSHRRWQSSFLVPTAGRGPGAAQSLFPASPSPSHLGAFETRDKSPHELWNLPMSSKATSCRQPLLFPGLSTLLMLS